VDYRQLIRQQPVFLKPSSLYNSFMMVSHKIYLSEAGLSSARRLLVPSTVASEKAFGAPGSGQSFRFLVLGSRKKARKRNRNLSQLRAEADKAALFCKVLSP
jgi:hypothetical protein